MTFGLDEETVELIEERLLMEELVMRKLLKAIAMEEAVVESKETKMIVTYRQNERRKPVNITFEAESSSQVVLWRAEKFCRP